MDTAYQPPDAPLSLLHEDASLLIVDKPAGLLSVPGRGVHLADCLLTRLQAPFPDARLVHRLDRDTSGVMVFALTAHAQRHLSAQFEARQVRKSYVAWVLGAPAGREGRIELPLIVDWPNRPKQKVCFETGKEAITDWRALRSEPGKARLRLTPHTGRSHQLRVHCAAMGHPILGDPFYGTGADCAAERMMLHAEELKLKHPVSGHSLKFRAKAPF